VDKAPPATTIMDRNERRGARLRHAGKTPGTAIVAVMRKLLVLAIALLRDNRPYAPA